ncbi:MAG: amylosucrase [Anaerolineae bacterium]|nr:alpha-glucosidase C-terminal domain-containing protein [Anaerolineales bacterium]MCQ3977500.1 amylosucrase [Anaerolineae bacterium]
MPDTLWLEQQADLTLTRLLPRLENTFRKEAKANPAHWQIFIARLRANFERLFELLFHLYGSQYDFFYHLEQILTVAARMWLARPAELKALDETRERDPLWFQSQQMVGGVCYVDLFAGDLNGIRQKIPYFKELGLTYLHLMPLFLCPEKENDGGYAVSSYRDVNPALGTMAQLSQLATELRHEGISLVVDFIFNHTSNEHDWARLAQAGQPEYQDYYRMFDDRTIPDQYQRNLRDIFPDRGSGSFTYWPDIHKWVWTTFYTFQWDLNYANPVVFTRMLEEMLFLANIGVEVLRLDAVAFIWKQMGTSCENLPEAHMLIQAFNALARIAAPSLLFKSEAIVHPDDVVKYISPAECQLSYNPLLMALLWNALATREVRMLAYSMRERFRIDPHCAWVNYVRVHDDIGWTFSDEDAASLGINGYDHRRFLNTFYTGRFPGSFARGLPFQENPRTGDARISGTLASLAGLEKALQENNPAEIELAIRRILLLHSIILSIGGIPLIYLGDEVGTLNDYGYRSDPAKAKDSRWVHRPFADWAGRMARRSDPDAIEGRIFGELRRLIELRKQHAALANGEMEVIPTHNDHVFGYVRRYNGERLLALANFTEQAQTITANEIRLHGLGYAFTDLVSGQAITLAEDIRLGPYQFMWLVG